MRRWKQRLSSWDDFLSSLKSCQLQHLKNAVYFPWKPVVHLKLNKKCRGWIVNLQPQLPWNCLFWWIFAQIRNCGIQFSGNWSVSLLCMYGDIGDFRILNLLSSLFWEVWLGTCPTWLTRFFSKYSAWFVFVSVILHFILSELFCSFPYNTI